MLFQQKQKSTKRLLQRFKESKFFLAIVMLAIGISWTAVYYEGRGLYDAMDEFFAPHTITITNTAHAQEKPEVAVIAETKVVPETPIDTIKRISAEEDIDWKLVYAVCLKESGCNPEIKCESQYGRCDDGLSFGAYQIYNPKLDPERKRMAENFEEATRWTIRHGYRFRDNPELFFKNHNGIAKTTNQWYVDGAMEIYRSI